MDRISLNDIEEFHALVADKANKIKALKDDAKREALICLFPGIEKSLDKWGFPKRVFCSRDKYESLLFVLEEYIPITVSRFIDSDDAFVSWGNEVSTQIPRA